MGTIIVAVILVVLVAGGVVATRRHFRGEGGCCGGGGAQIRETKTLDGPKLGEKTVKIEGMHCENCRNSVERAVNKLDGAVCKVNLKKNMAIVSYSKAVRDSDIRAAVEAAGFKVTEII